MRAAWWICVSLAVVVGGTSCSKRGDAPSRATVCFAFQDLETEFWVAGHKAITETLKSKGVEVLERNANQDANRQLEQIAAAIARGADGIIIIPQDGESAVTIVGEANKAGVPIAVFNRPPANRSNPAIVIVADNERISEQAVAYMAEQAKKLGRKGAPATSAPMSILKDKVSRFAETIDAKDLKHAMAWIWPLRHVRRCPAISQVGR